MGKPEEIAERRLAVFGRSLLHPSSCHTGGRPNGVRRHRHDRTETLHHLSMLASVDGKIDGSALQQVTPQGEYEAVAAKLGGEA